MKKVLIVTQYTSMPNSDAYGRFLYLADLLVQKEYDVEVITTNFYHRNKKHRIIDEKSMENVKYKFTMISEPRI